MELLEVSKQLRELAKRLSKEEELFTNGAALMSEAADYVDFVNRELPYLFEEKT